MHAEVFCQLPTLMKSHDRDELIPVWYTYMYLSNPLSIPPLLCMLGLASLFTGDITSVDGIALDNRQTMDSEVAYVKHCL